MLYQLSYLGRSREGQKSPASRRIIVGRGGAVYRPEGRVSTFLLQMRGLGAHPPRSPARPVQGHENAGLFDIVLVAFDDRDDIGAAEPAMQVDVAAARRAERAHRISRGPAADRTAANRLGGWGGGGLERFVCHGSLFRRPSGPIHPLRQPQTPTVLSQPKRIGKPSPASKVVASYIGRPTTLV